MSGELRRAARRGAGSLRGPRQPSAEAEEHLPEEREEVRTPAGAAQSGNKVHAQPTELSEVPGEGMASNAAMFVEFLDADAAAPGDGQRPGGRQAVAAISYGAGAKADARDAAMPSKRRRATRVPGGTPEARERDAEAVTEAQ